MAIFTGGTADDSFVGGADPDTAKGGGGNDVLAGLGGNDNLEGEEGDDALNGGDDDDYLIGGVGSDTLAGGAGADFIISHTGVIPATVIDRPTRSSDNLAERDILSGGAGDDFLLAGYGDDVDGGANQYFGDTLEINFLGSPTGLDLDFRTFAPGDGITIGGGTIQNIETMQVLEGTNFDDKLGLMLQSYGSIYAWGGNDQIYGTNNLGYVSGGDGNDIIDYSTGYNGTADGDAGDDTIRGNNGNNTFRGGEGNDTITGEMNSDSLSGGGGDDQIDGGTDTDSISGDAGQDRLFGGRNADTINGGDGDDVIYGDEGLFQPTQFQTADDDMLTGGAGADTIYGERGNDRIDGGADADELRGGTGDDTIIGGAGNDLIEGDEGDDTAYGGDGDDLLRGTSGIDQLSGDAGNDRLYFGAAFGTGDLAAGGAGTDTLILQGQYASGVGILASNTVSVEALVLLSAADNSYGAGSSGGSFSYAVTLDDRLVPAGSGLAIDAGGLAAGETLTFDASADTNSRFTVTGGAGNDDLTGGAGADSFFLQRGGNDRAIGGGGNDGFFFGGALTGADVVDGGAANDSVALQGNYAGGLTLTAITNVEFLSLLSGANTQFGEPGSNRYSYALTTVDANVAAGATLTVQATGLLASENLTFNGAAETNGNFRVFAGQGVDTLTGGAGSDGFFFGADGNLTGADRIEGGAGTDSVALRGNYVVALQDATFVNVEVLALLSGHSNEYGGAIVAGGYDYDVTLAEGNLAAGKSLDVVGSNLRADESLRLDGRAETDGSLRLFGGAGDDTLYGGSQADTLFGGLGQDRLEGGAGADIYAYQSAAQSTSSFYDMITGFDWNVDRIDAPGSTVRSFSQSAQGSLSTASFDADLTARVAGVLGANQAALFTANAGTLSGHIFAVIDGNGQAGYQAGQDIVIELINPVLPIDPTAGVII